MKISSSGICFILVCLYLYHTHQMLSSGVIDMHSIELLLFGFTQRTVQIAQSCTHENN